MTTGTVCGVALGAVSALAQAPQPAPPAAPAAQPAATPPPAAPPPLMKQPKTPPKPQAGDNLTELEEELAHFQYAAKDYRTTVNHVVKREYYERRHMLQARYEGQAQIEEKGERERRVSAIQMHEAFLRKYPNDIRWTPDVIFRLAELYFEKAEDEFLVATDEYDKALKGGQTPPAPPQKSYQRTIDLYKRLIAQFPTYRLLDAAEYLLGYCYGEQGQEPEAKQAYLALACANKYKPLDPPQGPKSTPASAGKRAKGEVEDPYKGCQPAKKDSKFLPETWTRLGEYHFDDNELDLAVLAYRRVLEYKDSNLYDKALYKLAWSYYRADRFPEAITQFDNLVKWSDAHKGEHSEKEGSDLRPEAIQYLGISFSEEDWDGDTLPDTETGLQRIDKFYKGREQEKHVKEVYRKLGDIYFDETKYDQAVAAYKVLLQKWPYDPDAPKVQDRIVTAYERQRDFGNSVQAREALARNFSKGTEWYKHNRDNPDALNQARDLAENSLLAAAIFHHKAAQSLKSQYAATRDPHLPPRIKEEYAVAGDLYGRYLERFPNSKNAYEYGYYYAEALYYSERYADALAQYRKIRDSNLDNRFQEDAAFSVIKANEAMVQTEIDAKRLEDPPIPSQSNTKPPIVAKPIPKVLVDLQAAYDWYAQRVKSDKSSQIAYTSALVSYKWLNWDGQGGARARMGDIVEKFCSAPEGAKAGDAMVMMYTIENNAEKIEEWAKRLAGSKCGGGQLASAKQGQYQALLNDVRFIKAQKLFEAGNYEEAGPIFLALVNEAPQDKNADKALNNAAVCFEKVYRYGEATKTYERIYREYPSSELGEEALFRAAVNHEKFFEFQEAVSNYLILAQNPRYKTSKHRTEALGLAAVLMERDQQYGRAADLYKQFASVSTKPDDSADAYYHAGLVYEKLHDRKRETDTLHDFLKKYGSLRSPAASTQVVQAHFKLAEAAEAQRDSRGAEDEYRKTVSEFASRGLPAAGDGAEPAAHAAFILTEKRFAQFKALKFKTANAKTISKSFDALTAEAQTLVKDYEKVWAYKRVLWTLAAFERMGDIYFDFGQKIIKSDVPDEIKRLEKKNPGMGVIDQYKEALDQKVAPVEKQAQDYWKKTLDKAAEVGVANEWTTLARKNLNAYQPEQFPLVKEARVEIQEEGIK